MTIDDITHVIDTGLVREMRYDPISQLASLSTINCSRASLTQRKGRAGLCTFSTCHTQFFRQSEERDLLEIISKGLDDECPA